MKKLSHESFICIGCKKDTWDEYYSLYTRVWRKANPNFKGMLCIECVEKRLGRKLNKNDFTKALINTIKTERTAQLKNRLGRNT